MLDPDQTITGKGILLLRRHGIAVDLFPPQLMAELEALNRKFIKAKEQEAAQILGRGSANLPSETANTHDPPKVDGVEERSHIRLYKEREDLYSAIIETIVHVRERQRGRKPLLLVGTHGDSGGRLPKLLHDNPVLERFDSEILSCIRSSGPDMWDVREVYNITSDDRLAMILERIGKAKLSEGYQVRAFCVWNTIPQFKPLTIGYEDLFLGVDDPTYYRAKGGLHIHGRRFTELAMEHFEQVWSDSRLFKLRTALGEDSIQVRLLTEAVSKVGRQDD
jgi:hypothetical protein